MKYMKGPTYLSRRRIYMFGKASIPAMKTMIAIFKKKQTILERILLTLLHLVWPNLYRGLSARQV